MSLCRSCQAEIRWVKTSTGKQMPIDLRPVSEGNIALTNGVATYVDPFVGEGPRYVSHFATCPHAAAHRLQR